jgi:hypothetical protein
MQGLFGINVETTDITILNLNGFYPVQPSVPGFDLKLYNASSTWVLVPIAPSGQGAQLDFTPVAKPLPEAKENGAIELKQQGDAATAQVLTLNYLTSDVVSAVASQDLIDRPAPLQVVLDEMVAVTDNLGANLVAVDSATSVDEIDSIVHRPTGIIVTGRGGASPEDMQPSYFTDLTNLPPGIGEPELEIYIPGTDTVIPYDTGLPAPFRFDSAGECYNVGDYRTTIRVAATGQVLSTVTPAAGPAVPIAWTYNSTIPSLGGGSSSMQR